MPLPVDLWPSDNQAFFGENYSSATGNWVDDLGLANNFAQATAGNRPAVDTTTAPSGRVMLHGDGVNDGLDGGACISLPAYAGSGFWVEYCIFVRDTAGTGSVEAIFDYDGWDRQIIAFGSSQRLGTSSDSSIGTTVQRFIMVHNVATGVTTQYLNGAAQTDTGTIDSNLRVQWLGPIGAGNRRNLSAPFDGRFGCAGRIIRSTFGSTEIAALDAAMEEWFEDAPGPGQVLGPNLTYHPDRHDPRARTEGAGAISIVSSVMLGALGLDITVHPDEVRRPGFRAHLQQAATLVGQPEAKIAKGRVWHPDRVFRPRFPAHLQQATTSLPPKPEQKRPATPTVFPDRLPRQPMRLEQEAHPLDARTFAPAYFSPFFPDLVHRPRRLPLEQYAFLHPIAPAVVLDQFAPSFPDQIARVVRELLPELAYVRVPVIVPVDQFAPYFPDLVQRPRRRVGLDCVIGRPPDAPVVLHFEPEFPDTLPRARRRPEPFQAYVRPETKIHLPVTYFPERVPRRARAAIGDAEIVVPESAFRPVLPEQVAGVTSYFKQGFTGTNPWVAVVGPNASTDGTSVPRRDYNAPRFPLPLESSYLITTTLSVPTTPAGEMHCLAVVELDGISEPDPDWFDTIFTFLTPGYSSRFALLVGNAPAGDEVLAQFWAWQPVQGDFIRASASLGTSAQARGRRIIYQVKKQDSRIWIRINREPWVQGPVVTDTIAESTLRIALGLFIGRMPAFAYFRKAQSDFTSDALVTWAETSLEFPIPPGVFPPEAKGATPPTWEWVTTDLEPPPPPPVPDYISIWFPDAVIRPVILPAEQHATAPVLATRYFNTVIHTGSGSSLSKVLSGGGTTSTPKKR